MSDNKTTNLTPQDRVEMYRLMLLSRRYTEHALEWFTQGRVPQGTHPSIGQEAVGVGACFGLRSEGDWIIPSLRTAEVFWTRGVKVLQQVHAMMGNTESISGGKETSHHAGYPEHGIIAGTGIVGGSLPVAVGIALALRMQGTDGIVVCFFGDGAANRGEFHESLNLAAVLKTPVIFICENNLYAQTVAASDVMAITDIADRAAGYGIPGHIVDGQDVVAVYEATQQAVSQARSGEGPTLLECKTYRFKPHYPVFEEVRPPEEIERWLVRDPIEILGSQLKEEGHLDNSTIEAMEKAIKQELDEAITTAETTPPPDPKEVFTNLYHEDTEFTGL